MINPQSENFRTLITQREGRSPIIQAFIEGIPDVLCTESPPDPKTKTYAVAFDQLDGDYIDCGTSSTLLALKDWTILGWIKLNSIPLVFPLTIVDASDGTDGYRFYITTTAKLQALQGGGVNVTLQGATVGTGAWTFVAISVGGNAETVVRGVINDTVLTIGEAAVTRASRTTQSSQSFKIGYSRAITSLTPDGSIGCLQLFNRAMDEREMRRLKYRFLTKAWGDDDSTGFWDILAGQWEMEEGTGTLVTNTRLPGTGDGTFQVTPRWTSDPPFTITYRPCLSAEASTGQQLEPLATKTTISTTTIKVLDTDEWFTSQMKTLALALPRRHVTIHLGLFGLREGEYQRVFTGKVTGHKFAARAYSITIGDALFESKTRIILGRSTLAANITNAAGQTIRVGLSTYWWDEAKTGYTGYVKIDDEIIGITADAQAAGNGTIELTANNRGQFGTTAAAHTSGAQVQEWWLPEDGVYWFTLVLRLLLSSFGSEDVSSYDVYSEFTDDDAGTRTTRARGVGMSPCDVSIADIAALSAKYAAATYRARWFITEDIQDLKDLIERELLQPSNTFFFTRNDGRLGIGTLKAPTSADVVYTIGPDQIEQGSIDESVSQDDIVNVVNAQYDWGPNVEDFEGLVFAADATSSSKYGLRKKDVTFRAADAAFSGSTIVGAYASDLFARFKDPYQTLELTCGLGEIFLEIGDVVRLTEENLPNVTTGYYGLHDQLWQVIGRKFDLRRGQVKLTLADVSRM